jgi:AmiR/NasT family two-component response regulator
VQPSPRTGDTASRARIVEAGDVARRRVEHNLRDGAQQRLVTLTPAIGMARSRLDPHAEPDADVLRPDVVVVDIRMPPTHALEGRSRPPMTTAGLAALTFLQHGPSEGSS